MARGIGWALLNREDDYLTELRNTDKPAFCVTVYQEDVGRIQGRQFGALLPTMTTQWRECTGDLSAGTIVG